jgi:hypothetical protein
VRPLAIVGHQYQSGGVDIQTPRGMQLVRHRLVEEIKDRRMIRIVGGTNVTLRLVEHKVARAGLLNQRIAVILDVMLRQKLEGGVFTMSPSTVTRLPRISRPAIARLTPSC